MSSTQSDERVGRIARILLADRALKQRDLGRALDMDSGQTSRALRGQRKWTITDLERMSEFFGVGVATFFEDADTIVRSRCVREAIRGAPEYMQERLFAIAA